MKTIEGLTAEEERAAAIFRALGNPARVRIVSELARRDACVTGDLVGLLPLAQSTVSQHLKVLRDAGIIRGTIEGDRCYCLDPRAIEWLVDFCNQVCCPAGVSCAPPEGYANHYLGKMVDVFGGEETVGPFLDAERRSWEEWENRAAQER